MVEIVIKESIGRLNIVVNGIYYYGSPTKRSLPALRDHVKKDLELGHYEERGFTEFKSTFAFKFSTGGYEFVSMSAPTQEIALRERNQFRDVMSQIRSQLMVHQ